MAEKVDRRVRKTKAQLRAGLARLMQKKSIKEITVKELVEEVDINRSTFYLHYTDIYQMLESIELNLDGECAFGRTISGSCTIIRRARILLLERDVLILDHSQDILYHLR